MTSLIAAGNDTDTVDVTPANRYTGDKFFYATENPLVLTELQNAYGKEVVTEKIYKNTCETKKGKSYYKKCDLNLHINTFSGFLDNVVCEQVLQERSTLGEYNLNQPVLRKEAVSMAVKMKRVLGNSVPLVSDYSLLKSTYDDVSVNDSAYWIPPTVATALKYNLITKNRHIFEAERSITRAEAFSIIMKSVCALPNRENTSPDWQKNVYTVAVANDITVRSWSNFSPDTPIIRSELITIASQAIDWAERTGGCDPKPDYCFLK